MGHGVMQIAAFQLGKAGLLFIPADEHLTIQWFLAKAYIFIQ